MLASLTNVDLMASPLSVAFPGLLNSVQLSVAATYAPVFQGRAWPTTRRGGSIKLTKYSDCFCRESLSNNITIVPDSQCSTMCFGNHSEYCGGPLVLSLYVQLIGGQVGLASPTTTSASTVPSSTPMTGSTSANPAYGSLEYKGCYTSKKGFPGFIPVNVASLDEATCSSAC
jgi:hypothetical protein